MIATLPAQLRRSLTWDQGAEMTQHARLRIDTGLAVYFCDPHSPWQRGSNEDSNGLLRQYFPRNAELSIYTRTELNRVARELNNRSRQTLGWMKPFEVFCLVCCVDQLRPRGQLQTRAVPSEWGSGKARHGQPGACSAEPEVARRAPVGLCHGRRRPRRHC
jgi:hypothetical protein